MIMGWHFFFIFRAEQLKEHPVDTLFMILATHCLLHEIQWFNWICVSQSDIFSNLISVLFSELTRISFPGQNGNPLSLKQNGKRMACYDFMITCNKKELWQAHDNSYKGAFL